MKILPKAIAPSDAPINRVHAPKPGHYGRYRPCLRWEFGFTCAFCLLHEADLFVKAEGTGLLSIEHLESQHQQPARRNEYANTFFACRFCNRARGTKPRANPTGMGSLLDPTITAWSSHFSLSDACLVATAGDDDATYTHYAYDLDDPRKVELRQAHALEIQQALKALEQFSSLSAEIEKRLAKTMETERRTKLVSHLRVVRSSAQKARGILERFQPVPMDADPTCRCMNSPQLPEHIVKQCLTVELAESFSTAG